MLDLDYLEDFDCDTDMNVVITGSGGIVEVQGLAEGVPVSRATSTPWSIGRRRASAGSRCPTAGIAIMSRLVIASGDAGKLREIARILRRSDRSRATIHSSTCPTSRTSRSSNCPGRGASCSARGGLPALADDSGVYLEALGGSPPACFPARAIPSNQVRRARRRKS